jgi:hypothetical protein
MRKRWVVITFVIFIVLSSTSAFSEDEKIGSHNKSNFVLQSASSTENFKIEYEFEDEEKSCSFEGFVLVKEDAPFFESDSKADRSFSIKGKLYRLNDEKLVLDIEIEMKCPGEASPAKYELSGIWVELGETINITFDNYYKKGEIEVNLV